MTFLNPYVLFALSAVAIPILLHLFNLKKVKKVEFSTLMFLKEIQKSKLRKIKLKQLLLLFLRIFLIIFLVLSFSNPVIKGYNFANADFKKSAVILFDDSFSMNARDTKGSYFEQSKSYIEKILQSYKPTDRVYFVPNSFIGMKDKFPLDAFTGNIYDSIKNLKPSYIPFRLSRVLKYSDDLISADNFLQYEIYLISDFQKINSDKSPDVQFKKLNQNSVYIYPVNVSTRDVHNISLENVDIKTKLLQKNKKINITIRAKNYNNNAALNKQVNLFVENEKVTETAVDIPAFESKNIDFSFRVNKTGSITGYAEFVQNDFSDDEIAEDNKIYFSFYIPDVFNVMLVGDNSSGTSYIKTAIETAINADKDSLNPSYKRYNVSEYNSVTNDLKNSDVVIISGKKIISENENNLLTEFLNEGKGIFIFPDRNSDINSYNSLFTKLNSFRINNVMALDEATTKNLKFTKIDFEHPLVSGIFKNENLSITSEFNVETPEIKSIFDIAVNEKSYSVMTLSNGKPFLIESGSSNGKVIICAVSALNDMSDFPLKSLFAPIVIRGIEYLSNINTGRSSNVTGTNNLIFVKGLKDITEVILPDGKKIPFKLNLAASKQNNFFDAILFPYNSYSSEIGKYSFRNSDGNSSYSFVLNFDTLECKMQRADKKEIMDYFNELGMKNVKYINNPSAIKEEISENRNGSELWKYCLIIALLFLAAEMYYSKKLEKS